MEKIYRVKLNSSGMPNFSTAVEIPQGEWIFDLHDTRGINTCSECGNIVKGYGVNIPFYYCPFCGADMRKGADDE
jgi:hypothetical protein